MKGPTVRDFNGWLAKIRSGGRFQAGPRLKVYQGAQVETGKTGKITAGSDLSIRSYSILDAQGGEIALGDRCVINSFSVLYGFGGIQIGSGVRIAAHSVLVSSNYNIEQKSLPLFKQGLRAEGISIANDVWIGANCVVLDGSKIAEGCVIAAGSVVRGHTEPYGVYAGTPIKLLRKRT